MTAEIKDVQGLFTSGITLAYVDNGVVTGAGGPFTSGQDIVKVENGNIREVGGFLGTGETVATLQGNKIVSNTGFLSTGDIIAVIDGNKIRDSSGVVFTKGDLIAEIEGQATKEEKAAAATAVALGYIDQNASLEDMITQEAGDATGELAENIARGTAKKAAKADASELFPKIIKYTAAIGVFFGVAMLFSSVLAILDFLPGLSFDAEGIWVVFESGVVGGLVALGVFIAWVGGSVWYFIGDYLSSANNNASDSSATADQEGMQVDADFTKEELREKVRAGEILSPTEAAGILHEFNDFDYDVDVRTAMTARLLDTAIGHSPEEIYQQYQGSAVMQNSLMDEFYSLITDAEDLRAKRVASSALLVFARSYPEWLTREENADALRKLVLNSVEDPAIIEKCLRTLAIGVAANSGRLPVDKEWFDQFESHENEQIQLAAYSAKSIACSGETDLPSPDNAVVDSDVDIEDIRLKIFHLDTTELEFTPAEAATTLPLLTHPDPVKQAIGADILSMTADDYSALAIFEEYTGTTLTPYAAMDIFYELVIDKQTDIKSMGASALHLFMMSYPEWAHQEENEQNLREVVETELEHPAVVGDCLLALALGVAYQPEQSVIDEIWFNQFAESPHEEISERADVAKWLVDRGRPVNDPANKFK